MKCGIQGCSGEYDERHIVHTMRHNNEIVVIDHVPAQVCSTCGDTLLKPETVRRIEIMLLKKTAPVGSVPLYEYS
jgi:YgiT-type zinc finger domain-containing protein